MLSIFRGPLAQLRLRSARFPCLINYDSQIIKSFGNKYSIKSNPSFSLWLNSCYELGRYSRPIGTWLLYLPCTWSIAIAAPPGHLPDFGMLALFGVGSILMRGAGCTINDLWDRRYDRYVERTKARPLAAGLISVQGALVFLTAQLAASLIVLLQLNWFSVGLGLLSMAPVLTYPLFKRITYWPQLVLGFTFNWGALLGYSAVIGHIDPCISFPLYIAGINWTIVYDTIYAHQDIEDDMRIGVKSTALLFGDQTKPILVAFQSAMALCLLTLGINMDATWVYYLGTSVTMAHISFLIYITKLKDPVSCLSTFKASRTTGLLILVTLIANNLITTK